MLLSRPRAFAVLFGASGLLALANGVRHLVQNDSAVDQPIAILSLIAAAGSAVAWWAVRRRARWTMRAVWLWAGSVAVATIGGSVLLRPYMSGLVDLVPGPLAALALSALVIRRARQRFAREPLDDASGAATLPQRDQDALPPPPMSVPDPVRRGVATPLERR